MNKVTVVLVFVLSALMFSCTADKLEDQTISNPVNEKKYCSCSFI